MSSLGRLRSWLLHLCGVVYVPLVEFMCFVFTRMPGESSLGRLRSWLLCLCGVVYVPLVEFMYSAFSPMPGESSCR